MYHSVGGSVSSSGRHRESTDGENLQMKLTFFGTDGSCLAGCIRLAWNRDIPTGMGGSNVDSLLSFEYMPGDLR